MIPRAVKLRWLQKEKKRKETPVPNFRNCEIKVEASLASSDVSSDPEY
jgi:hypothetical protein